MTRSPCIPGTGLGKQTTVKFKHDCFPKSRPSFLKCLPTVRTCVIILILPVHITAAEEMMSVFKDVLICETGLVSYSRLKVMSAIFLFILQ